MAFSNVMFQQKAVLIGRGTLGDTFALGTLTAANMDSMAGLKALRALKIEDHAAKKNTDVFVYSKHTHPKVRAFVRKAIKIMQESGIVQHVYETIPLHMVTTMLGPISASMLSKLANKIEEQKIDMMPIELPNTYNMIKFCIALMLLNVFTLVIETVHEKIMEARRKVHSSQPVWRLVTK